LVREHEAKKGRKEKRKIEKSRNLYNVYAIAWGGRTRRRSCQNTHWKPSAFNFFALHGTTTILVDINYKNLSTTSPLGYHTMIDEIEAWLESHKPNTVTSNFREYSTSRSCGAKVKLDSE
jgi:hypothetical protein